MTKIYHGHVWGSRKDKFRYLLENDINTVEWTELNPQAPFYLFIPFDTKFLPEYETGWKITDIMPVNVLGFQTHRDSFAIDFEKEKIYKRIAEMRNNRISDEEYYRKYNIKDNRDWKLKEARQVIKNDSKWEKKLITCLYRPFDWRYCYFSKVAMDYPRTELMNHVAGKENLVLNLPRIIKLEEWRHALVAHVPSAAISIDINGSYVIPLYLYPNTQNQQSSLFVEKSPNLSSDFLSAIKTKLGYIPTPEAIFYYIYAIFHSPTYRQRYAQFLKIDFPRVPLTSNNQLFKDLGTKGKELVDLHLMKSKKLNKLITKMGGEGDNAVTKITYNCVSNRVSVPEQQRVYINKTSYFEGIAPEVWEFKIGGYQVLDKWLKDRKKAKRSLSFDDMLHYQKVVVALKETIELMREIDGLIPGFPIE